MHNIDNQFNLNTSKFLIPIFSLIILITMAFPSISYAQTSGWSDPIRLTTELQGGAFPEVISDAEGNVHIFWYTAVGDYDEVMYQEYSRSGVWSKANDVLALNNGTSRIITRPAAAIDHFGRIDLLFRDFRIYLSSVLIDDASDGNAWSEKQLINTGESTAYFSNIKIDKDDTYHVVFTENVPSTACSICFGLFYIQSDDQGQTWTDPLRVNPNGRGSAKPQLLIDNNNNLFMVWEAGLGGDLGQITGDSEIMFSRSRNNGITWAQPVILNSETDPYGNNPSIGMNNDGQIVIAWVSDETNLFSYVTSDDNGETWSAINFIPNLTSGRSTYRAVTDGTSMATDSAGIIHFVVVGKTSSGTENLSVFDLKWDGVQWSMPSEITTYTNGDAPEWPRLAISNGNRLNVVWFVRGKDHIWDAQMTLYHVWYSQSITNAPEVLPENLYTPQPSAVSITPTEMVEQTPSQITVTPIPTTIIIHEQEKDYPLGIGQPAYQETDYLGVIGITLVPAFIFIVGAIVAIVFMRRRH